MEEPHKRRRRNYHPKKTAEMRPKDNTETTKHGRTYMNLILKYASVQKSE
jgi:hypothetical protein